MDTKVAPQRVLVYEGKISAEEAQAIAWKKKVDAFGTVERVVSFLSRPKDEDFQLLYSEHRYQPFWHVKGWSKYVYDRTTVYKWPVSGKEVKDLTISRKDYQVVDGNLHVEATDHCVQEEHLEEFVDGISGEHKSNLNKYLSFTASIMTKASFAKLNKAVIMVPPKARVSAVVNEVLASSVKVIQADKIFEEKIEISNVDLYYHPVYAFQYKWVSKNKDMVIAIDALTGEISYGHNIFKEYLGKLLDQDFLFDVGADAAGTILPGASIAVKIAKKYIDSKKK